MRIFIALCLWFLTAPAFAQSIDSPPRLVSEVPVEYPPRALEERLETSVLLMIDIDVEGRVTRSEVLEASEHSGYGFEEAVQAAIAQFKFAPALSQGKPVPVRVQYRYRFVLPEAPSETHVPEAAPQDAPTTPEAPSVYRGPVGELWGVILERGRRSPLVGVTIVVERAGEAYEAITDEEGKFSFYDLPAGKWTFTAESTGYLPVRSEEEVFPNERTNLTLYIERGADNPYDVTVEAHAPKREVTRRKLVVQEVATQPGTFGDPILAVENLPGVAVMPFDPTGVAMRGAAPDESSMYIEGFRIPFLYHLIGVRSILAPGMLDSFDLYPGGAPIYYGRQTGGVLDARLKRLAPDRVHGYVDVSLLDAGFYLEAPLNDRVAVAVATRASYADQIMRAFGSPLPRYNDYHVMLEARPRGAHTFKLFYVGSDDWFSMDAAELESAQITSGNLEAALHLQHVAVEHAYAPSKLLSNRLRLGYLHWDTMFHLGDGARVDAVQDAFLMRDTFRVMPTDYLALELGVDAELGRWTTDVLIGGRPTKEGEPEGYIDFNADRRAFNRNVQELAAGAWMNLELRPFSKLLLVPGVRMDLQPRIEELTFDPRVMARYEIIPQLAVKAGTAVNHAAPAIDETTERFGNPNLGAERSLQHSGGVEVRPLDYLTLDVTGFYHQLDGLAVPSDRLVTVGDRTVSLQYENTGEGRAYGFEVMLRHELAHRLSGWLAYTYARAERRRDDSERYRLFDLDQTHSFVAVAAYQLPRHFQVSTRFRFRSGQPTTPVVGATFVSDSDEYAPVFGRVNSRRLDAFHQLDLRIDKQWLFNKWSFSAYLDIQNVYNHKNAAAIAYNFDYSKRDKFHSIPFLPVVGVKAEY